jgi:hypothetical protein
MRKIPFNTTAAPATPQADTPQKVESVNLIDRLKPKAQLNSSAAQPVNDKSTARGVQPNTAKPDTETTTTVDENESTTAPGTEDTTEEGEAKPAAPSATFEDFKETATRKVEQFVQNPEELAIMLVRFGNVARTVFLPTLYTNLLFPGQEGQDVRGVAAKAIANEKDNKAADTDFNNYEKRLYGKWQKRDEIMAQISYTEEEIKWLGSVLAKRIKDVGVAVWLEKYDWLLALLYLEFKHSQLVWSMKASDFMEKKFAA